MNVAMFVDPYSYDGEDKDHEYEEIERFVKETFPGRKLFFKRGVQPYGNTLLETVFDLYVFDIGGMCYVCHNGSVQTEFCKNVLKLATEDRPSSYFLPWSSMSRDYIAAAVYELWIDEPNDEEEEASYTTRLPYNVWCPEKSRTLAFGRRECEEDMRRWLQRNLSKEG